MTFHTLLVPKKKKSWNKEDLIPLKFAYPNKDFFFGAHKK